MMSRASFESWVANGWIRPRQITREELLILFQIARRDLKDAQCTEISSDTRFSCAYNGVLKLATLLLYSAGYEPERNQSHHYRIIEAIPMILGPDCQVDADYLNECRKKRNAADYFSVDTTSEEDTERLIRFAQGFLKNVEIWLTHAGWIDAGPST